MRGTNELHLNEATLMEAVQEYLDKRSTKPVAEVTSVKWNRDCGSTGTFVVSLREIEDDA